MKTVSQHSLFFLLFFLASTVSAQIKIGEQPREVHPYALLEIKTNQHGILIPRLTVSQRTLAFQEEIPNGLIIFNTDYHCIEIYDAATQNWKCTNSIKNNEAITGEETPLLFELNGEVLTIGDQTIDLSQYTQKMSVGEGMEDTSLILLENGNTLTLKAGNNVTLVEDGETITIGTKTNITSATYPQRLSFSGTLLSLENGGSVDLAPLANTVPQTLSISGTQLTLSAGGSVDLNNLPGVSSTELQTLTLQNDELSISGVVSTIDLSGYTNTDTQTLTLQNDELSISGVAATIDLSRYTDTQTLTLQNDELSISGVVSTIDLSGYTNTDTQTLTLQNDELSISGVVSTIDLSGYTNTDTQTLTLQNDELSISGVVSTVDLSGYTNTDTQTLRLSPFATTTRTIMTLENGGAITLLASGSLNFGSKTDTTTLELLVLEGSANNSLYQLDGELSGSRTVSMSTHSMTFVTDSGTTTLYLGEEGNIGIGTTTPSKPLEVDGGVRLSGLTNQTTTTTFSQILVANADGDVETVSASLMINPTTPVSPPTLLHATTGSTYYFSFHRGSSNTVFYTDKFISFRFNPNSNQFEWSVISHDTPAGLWDWIDASLSVKKATTTIFSGDDIHYLKAEHAGNWYTFTESGTMNASFSATSYATQGNASLIKEEGGENFPTYNLRFTIGRTSTTSGSISVILEVINLKY